MSFSGLLNSLWNSKSDGNKSNVSNISNVSNNPPPMRGTQGLRGTQNTQDIYSQTNINTSVPISQGKEYMLYKQGKVNTVNNEINSFKGNDYQNSYHQNAISNSNSNYGNIREGFDGMIGPSQVNKKNQQDSSNRQNMEDDFNRSISSYASSQKNLMDKSQQFLQGKRTYGKNIHALQAANTDDIIPNWVGCYKSGNDGLIEQSDLGNNTNLTDCKVRASDLGYSTFALRQKGDSPGNTCFVGDNIDTAQSGGLATKSVISYAFSKSEGANIGGLMMNGQIGVYEDDITTNLKTDLTALANCDISIGGQINANTTVATYGYNCNGTAKSQFTAPPPQQAPEISAPGGYTKYNNKDSGGNDIIKLADGTSIADLAAACDKNLNCSGFNNGGWVKSVIKPEEQWGSGNWNGKQLDLYVKNKNSINIDTTKQYRLKDVNSSNCLYNNSDGRFNTFQCIDFNDQYWTLTAVPQQTNTYMFKGVNSQYSLFADTNGQFRTAISDINNPTQQWELIPISGQADTYQLKNKKTSTCLYNNADGRFNMSGCVAAYNDQWWKLIPISSADKVNCSKYGEGDTNLPDECYNEIWKSVCPAPMPPTNWWRTQTKQAVQWNMYEVSTMPDPRLRAMCYTIPPVAKTGSTVNTGSLWSKTWVRIDNGTWANSLSQLNDGTILCTNGDGNTYLTQLNNIAGWVQQTLSIPVKSVIQLQDGRFLGVGKNDNSLYIKDNISDRWEGWNPSSDTGTQVVIPKPKSSCHTDANSLVRGQTVYTGCGYTYATESARNAECGSGAVADATSCKGWDCTIEGQKCPKGAPGAENSDFFCKNSKWTEGAGSGATSKWIGDGYTNDCIDRAQTVYSGCGYTYATESARNAQCGPGGTSMWIGDGYTPTSPDPPTSSGKTRKVMVRYVKININKNNDCLQISQLAVYSNGINIAPGKTASAPNIYSSQSVPAKAIDGTLSTRDYPNIYHSACRSGDYWLLDLGAEYDVEKIVYYNRRDCCSERANGMVLQIFNNNMTQTQFTQGNFTLNSDMVQTITLQNTQIPDPNTCCVLSIIQLNNGSLIGVGTDNYLYKRNKLSDNWKQIKCPSSCCVTSVSKLSDGNTIVAIGTNGYIYTRQEDQKWTLVDQSMKMSAVTQLKDGRVIGLDQNGNYFSK
jgi:hypothetical protein